MKDFHVGDFSSACLGENCSGGWSSEVTRLAQEYSACRRLRARPKRVDPPDFLLYDFLEYMPDRDHVARVLSNLDSQFSGFLFSSKDVSHDVSLRSAMNLVLLSSDYYTQLSSKYFMDKYTVADLFLKRRNPFSYRVKYLRDKLFDRGISVISHIYWSVNFYDSFFDDLAESFRAGLEDYGLEDYRTPLVEGIDGIPFFAYVLLTMAGDAFSYLSAVSKAISSYPVRVSRSMSYLDVAEPLLEKNRLFARRGYWVLLQDKEHPDQVVFARVNTNRYNMIYLKNNYDVVRVLDSSCNALYSYVWTTVSPKFVRLPWYMLQLGRFPEAVRSLPERATGLVVKLGDPLPPEYQYALAAEYIYWYLVFGEPVLIGNRYRELDIPSWFFDFIPPASRFYPRLESFLGQGVLSHFGIQTKVPKDFFFGG